jgi:hypothetical protein
MPNRYGEHDGRDNLTARSCVRALVGGGQDDYTVLSQDVYVVVNVVIS